MATRYWIGGGTGTVPAAVAQIATAQVTGYDVASTFSLSVNNYVITSCIAQGSAIATATALVSGWNASTHPYATPVTAANGGGASDTITFTGDTGGIEFTVTPGVSGGAGTFGAFSISTSAAGPHNWSTSSNWSDATVPVAADDVIIADGSCDILWGLDQNAIALTSLTIRKSFTGKIGKNYRALLTNEAGTTTNTNYEEYRQCALKIGSSRVDIGEHFGAGSPAGSGRLYLDLHTTAATVVVHDTAAAATDTGRPSVNVICNQAGTTLDVRKGPGGVGIAANIPDETATLGTIKVGDASSSTTVLIGKGTTLTTLAVAGGVMNVAGLANTLTTLNLHGGTVTTEGDYTITTGQTYGGTWYCNHIKTAGNALTTLNIDGGTVDGTGSTLARTWATVNARKTSTLKIDGSVVTITTLNDGTTGVYTMEIS